MYCRVTVRRVDIHQHLWPDGLLSSLARRTVPPRLRRDGRDWLLELAGDAPAPFDPREHDPATAPRWRVGRAAARPDRARRARSASSRCRRRGRGAAGRLPLRRARSWARRSSCGRASCSPTRAGARRTPSSTRAPSDSPCPRARSAGPRASRGSARRSSAWRARGAPLFIHPGPAAGCARVVSRAHRLRGRDVDRLARLGAVGAAGAPVAARRVRDARRAGAAARRAARRARRPERRGARPPDAFDTSSYGPQGDRRDAARRRRGPAAVRLGPAR